MSSRPRTLRILSAAAVALAFIGIAASATSAASAAPADAASFSRDGVTFTAQPHGALFAGIGAIVPGQRETARLWVRNDGTSALVIRVNATDVNVDDPDYAAALSLRATTTTQPSGARMTFATAESCFLLLGEQYLLPGETIPVTIRLAMGDVSGSLAQDATASATLAVGMREAGAPWVEDGECDGDGAHLPVLGDPDPGTPTPTTPTHAHPGTHRARAGSDAAAIITGGPRRRLGPHGSARRLPLLDRNRRAHLAARIRRPHHGRSARRAPAAPQTSTEESMTITRNEAPRERGLLHYIGIGLSFGLLALVIALAALLIVVPKVGGATPLTVLTQSMEPTLPPGTLVVVGPVEPADVRVGDVVTYQIRSGEPERHHPPRHRRHLGQRRQLHLHHEGRQQRRRGPYRRRGPAARAASGTASPSWVGSTQRSTAMPARGSCRAWPSPCSATRPS